jgi:hypothetical protein
MEETTWVTGIYRKIILTRERLGVNVWKGFSWLGIESNSGHI